MISENIFCSVHVVNVWNHLPKTVVNASMVNAFKAQLDKFWLHKQKKQLSLILLQI